MTLKGFLLASREVSMVVRTSASAWAAPHGAITVGDLSLDHARSQLSLRGVVGDVHLARIVAECEQLISGAPDLGLQLAGEIAPSRGDQQGCELLFQLALFPRTVEQAERIAEHAAQPLVGERLKAPASSSPPPALGLSLASHSASIGTRSGDEARCRA